MEWETSLGFQVDHYVPSSRGGGDEYTNLYYACTRCNRLKDNHPPPALAQQGYRVFCPDKDDPDDHFQVRGVRVEGRTEHTGEYTEHLLRLNRKGLREIRDMRRRLNRSTAAILRGIQALRGLKIDSIGDPIARARFIDGRDRLVRRLAAAKQEIDDEFARLLARHPDQDEDSISTKSRRDYLERIGAVRARKKSRK